MAFNFYLAELWTWGDDRAYRSRAIGNEENYMIVLNGTGTIADVVTLADRRDRVAISPEVLDIVGRAYERAADLSARFPTYGRTTGIGANRSTPVLPGDKDFGMRLLRIHAADAGDP